MARAEDTEVIDLFEEFYRNYYRNEIGDLAQKYPNEKKSLYVDWQKLYRFDPDLADDFRNHPEQFQDYAEEALRLYDLPVDVKLGQAHVRVTGLPETTEIRQIRADHRGKLISVQGIIRKATDVRPKVTTAAFECQRCGTLSRIPQTAGEFQEPHECQGCERQGPFRINYDQSEFVDAQKLRVQESPEGLRGGETPQSIDVNIEDDITGEVTAGDHVRVTGTLKLDQQANQGEKSPMFDVYMEGSTVEIEDEQFEDMNIDEEDKREIVSLSEEPDIYEQMVDSIAPSIYGYEQAKLAMILQLFSGVTKHLPDESRIRGDLHMLLIGDPGTGKCQKYDTMVTLSDGREVQIGDLVENHLDDPIPVDDGVYGEVSISLPTVTLDGTIAPGTATKVWKREAPDEMYRIEVSTGRELEVTPSHPLFVNSGGRLEPRRADALSEGDQIAVLPESIMTDGGTIPAPRSSATSSPTVHWSRIESIERTDPDYDWVYDLEVPGTHSYLSEGIVSHNSQMLQYIREIAPRSVYTSGKGSSSAGLCVAGDTLIHTSKGRRQIRDLVETELPDPVVTETAAEKTIDLQTFDREAGEIVERASSLVWRMPERPCRRIETSNGKELEASLNTPVLTSGENGIEWTEISAVEVGDSVAVPRYADGEYGDSSGHSQVSVILGDGGRTVGDSRKKEAVEADLRWDEVVAAVDTGEKEVFDLTVPDTHNFVGNGIVTHNTAAAVRDDFGDGQQWTLEAGALVLADQGIAAVDELDKMRCVTGETLVHLGDGRVTRISDLAHEAAETGDIEQLPNGRTIRDVDFDAWAMTDDGRLVRRPVTAVHEYDAPDELTRVTLRSGQQLTTTHDHPYFVSENGERIETPAAELDADDRVYVPAGAIGAKTDGGQIQSAHGRTDVECVCVSAVETVTDHDFDCVYDLTVGDTHNFIANSMVVHNSEDRSAMHEALEQQSYHPESEILLADGRRVAIGDLVDEKMATQPESVVDGVDCEILPVDDVGVHSVDLDTNEVEKRPVDRVSRHEAPEEFVHVTFSNGRGVLVTPEHPMFVDDDGTVGTVEAREIEAGAFVPAPRKLPNSAEPVALDPEGQQGKEKDGDLPEELSPDLAELLGLLTAGGHSDAGSAHEIGFSNQDERLLSRAARLMRDVFGMESTDTTNAAGTVTKRWVSTTLYRWFEENFPEVMHTARGRRIPAAVLGASEEEIRRFLVGALAGDGGVESEATSYTTASAGLARDYADALSKLGVASRIHHDTAEDAWKVSVMSSTAEFVEQVIDEAADRYQDAQAFVERSEETRRHHDVLPTSAAGEIRALRRLLGLRLTGKFRPDPDEGYGVQVETVESELETLRERAAELRGELPTTDTLSEIRDLVGWSCRELGERLGETGSIINYAENGGYDETRRAALAAAARTAVEDALATFERRAEALQQRCDLRYYRVTDVETVPNEGEYACDWVYDVTVEPTNTFVSQGVVLHNSISVSKAGINATLKSRCSLLGAANPKYGRFDQYEPISEQIDLEPALISRFDLIFTVTDQPDEEKDRNLAEHIIQTNYAGELNTHREQISTPDYTEEEVARVTEEVAPTIDAELLRKYVAYAKRNVFPTMTEEAKDEIENFYVDLRSQGSDEDAPVPVTARKLEALVRLAEASARIRLSDTVERGDAERVIEIVRSCLEAIGLDPETGELDADVIETGTSKSQRDRIKNLKTLIAEIEDEYDDGAPFERVLERAEEAGMDSAKAEHEIEKLKQQGEVYEPRNDHLRTT